MTLNLETLLAWDGGKRVNTHQGPRILHKAAPTQQFWDAWRAGKDNLKKAGISCGQSKQTGEWEVCWWKPLSAEVIQEESDAINASLATTTDFEPPCPAGRKFYPYQKAGIAYALRRQSTLIADAPGLGKTCQAIGVFNSDPAIKSVLVICPASLRINWRREWLMWSTRPCSIAIVNGGKSGDWTKAGAHKAEVVIVNYDVVAKQRDLIDAREWDLLILDESHFAKSPDAKRTRAILGHKSKGKYTVQPIKARRRLLLTGTPILNRPIELWTTCQALDPDDLGRNYFKFAERYCAAYKDRFGYNVKGCSNPQELQTKLRSKFMVRRLKEEVLKDLPPKTHQVIELSAEGCEQAVQWERAAYEKHREAIEALQAIIEEKEARQEECDEERGELRRRVSLALGELARARHQQGLAKVPAVIEHLETALESGPVLVFAHHADVIEQIKAAFPGSVSITGSTSMADRDAAVQAFQNGQANLFIGNIQAAGVGLTLTRSSHVVFAELSWVPAELAQAADRAHRIGQRNNVLVQYLVLEDSVDSMLIDKLIQKQVVINSVLDAPVARPKVEQVVSEIEIDLGKALQQEKQARESSIDEETRANVHLALRLLSGVCDGAKAQDDMGFNGTDSAFGKSLAAQDHLTDRQVACGLKVLQKYRRQIPETLYASLFQKS